MQMKIIQRYQSKTLEIIANDSWWRQTDASITILDALRSEENKKDQHAGSQYIELTLRIFFVFL